MNKATLAAIFLLSIFNCFSPEQDLPVNPPQQPHYSIYGQVLDAEQGTIIPGSTVSMAMEILIQGEWVDKKNCVSDSTGSFKIDSLYRGQYQIEATQRGKTRFSKSIDMINYSDREYDIIIPPPPDLVLRGKVTRCSDGVNVSEVQVTLKPLWTENGGVVDEQTDITNSIGNFQFQDLYEGSYRLSALKGNYTRSSHTIYIPANGESYFRHDFCMNESIAP